MRHRILIRGGAVGNKTAAPAPSPAAPALPAKSALPSVFGRLSLRPYQQAALENHSASVEVWLWARGTGKSFALAAWAIARLITRPGRVATILVPSLQHGLRFHRACAQISAQMKTAFEQEDLSPGPQFESMHLETRITVDAQIGRIQILPATPQTARAFSGDIILDDFAFHENSVALWKAIEPLLAANPDRLCRVASIPNGCHNMFHRLATDARIPVRKVTRATAWQEGCPVVHPVTGADITPRKARQLASHSHDYDQDFECEFHTEKMPVLTRALIHAAERPHVGDVWEQSWGPHLKESGADLFVGVDVGRDRNLTVITVLERFDDLLLVRGILRLKDAPLQHQQQQLAAICSSWQVKRVHIDVTGLGLGLHEATRQSFGAKIHGINFARTVFPSHSRAQTSCEKIPLPDYLAALVWQVFEDQQIRIPVDPLLREDLRLPHRSISPAGRMNICPTASGGHHADHFWSLALALHAFKPDRQPLPVIQPIRREVIHSVSRMPRIGKL